MNGEEPVGIALKVLAFIAADAERLAGLLSSSGLEPENLREHAQDPELLAGILDYLLSDESMMIEFCTAAELPPESIGYARSQLPGFSEPM